MELKREELNLIRQWFNCVKDITPEYLREYDYDLMERILNDMRLSSKAIKLADNKAMHRTKTVGDF